jgi:hypothetical protein
MRLLDPSAGHLGSPHSGGQSGANWVTALARGARARGEAELPEPDALEVIAEGLRGLQEARPRAPASLPRASETLRAWACSVCA